MTTNALKVSQLRAVFDTEVTESLSVIHLDEKLREYF